MALSAADHVLAMMRIQRRLLATHEPGVRRGTDPEGLHRMRTAARRLRATMRTTRSLLGPPFEPLERELDWLGTVLGKVRDVDVLRAHLRAELRPLDGAGAPVIRRVLAHLETERARARAGVLAALASSRYARLRDGLREALRRPRLAADDVSLVGVARHQFKKLRKAVHALPATPSSRQLHAVRIRVKRARYAAELAEATGGRRGRRFIRKAAALQDILGEHQDAVVAEQRLRQLARTPRGGGPAVRRLLERQRGRRRAAWAAFQDQWPKLERRGRKAWG
jgi:CHAD domain-containing protein